MASPEYTDSPDPWAGLGPWGWDDLTRRRFEAAALGGEQPARVLRADRGACVVALCDGERHLPIDKRLGSDSEERPTTGDWAVVRGGEVIAVLERRTAVVRAAADPSGKPQVLAANVDNVLLLEPLTDRWRPRRLERLLVIAWQSGARPIVVLTKADLVASVDEALAKAMSVAPGVSVHAVSSVEGLGIDRLLA
ncbi:MAG: GTPase RsgA, partial [Acidimicrobiales bacterium]